ncbi:MAG TPA: hypothetical protein VLC71_11395 [Thermomonas sp.]|nr:hypothetical protein [Thermomonas sp.]
MSTVRSVASTGLALAVGLGLLAVSPTASAVDPLDTFSFRIGGYVNTFDTQLRADGQTTTGTEFDLDRDLNLDKDSTIGLVGVTWRPFEKHEFAFSYRQDDKEATTHLQRDINFDGTVYPRSATVRSQVAVDVYEASYVWWAASHDTWAIGPRLGLTWYSVDMRIDMERDAAGNPVNSSVSSDVSLDLPEPTIGGSWRWTPSKQWRLSADAGFLTTDIGDVDADVFFARAGVEWYPWERTGFWLDYTISDIDANIDKDRYNGSFVLRDSGIRLGVAYRF